MTEHTGTITEAQAILQQERIKAIMAETSCTFAEAGNQYIKEKYGLAVVQPTPIVSTGNV
jgi:hypothetical protein